MKNKALSSEYEEHKSRYGAKDLESRYKDSVNSCKETQGKSGKQKFDWIDMRKVIRDFIITKILLIKQSLTFLRLFFSLIFKGKIFMIVFYFG